MAHSQTEIINILEESGFSHKESKLYLAALQLGLGKASEIAKKCGMSREAVYYTIKILQSKGILSESLKSGVKHYSSIAPKAIPQLIEERTFKQTTAIKEIIPELNELRNVLVQKPKIALYEGLQGYKAAATLLLQEKNIEHYVYASESILKIIPIFDIQFRRKRKENNIHLKVITQNTSLMRELRKKDKEELREIRFNEIIKNIDVAYYISEKFMIILKANQKDQLGIYVEESSAAKLQKAIFDQIWKESK